MYFTDFTGLAGVSLFISLIILRFNIFHQMHSQQRVLLLAAVLLMSWIPINSLSIAEGVRGVTGDLSVTALILLGVVLGRAVFPSNWTVCGAQKNTLLLLLVITGVVFYPLVLGWGIYDPYRLGFGNVGFITVLLFLSIIAWWQHQTLIAISVSLAVLAWSVNWYESNNLWDYLIDPWLFLFALTRMINSTVQGLRRKLI